MRDANLASRRIFLTLLFMQTARSLSFARKSAGQKQKKPKKSNKQKKLSKHEIRSASRAQMGQSREPRVARSNLFLVEFFVFFSAVFRAKERLLTVDLLVSFVFLCIVFHSFTYIKILKVTTKRRCYLTAAALPESLQTGKT